MENKPNVPEEDKKKKKKRIIFIILLWFFIVIFAVSSALLGIHLFSGYDAGQSGSIPSVPTSSTESEIPKVDNPINFAEMSAKYPDIVGWICIPDTVVDYPVMQSAANEEEDFYIHHDPAKNYLFAGSIYMQKCNSSDFTNANTVLYGHNMANGSMFASVRYYWGADYFEKHPYIYVYTPGHILTYEVYSGFKYDDRHILNSFNFNSEEGFAEYIEMTKNPRSMTREVHIKHEPTTADRLLTLSTCTGQPHERFIVVSVLINDQPTY